MVKYKFNEPFYRISFSELDEDKLSILSFNGFEEISGLYKYQFELLSTDPKVNAIDILNKKAVFIIAREDKPIYIHGIISRFIQRGSTPNYFMYYAELVPTVWRLGLTFQSRIFQKMNIADLIEEIMHSSGFSGSDFEMKLQASYPEQEYIVQYRESDHNFLNRRLEHLGIFYYFEHKNDNDIIVFCDSNDSLSSIEDESITYNNNPDPLGQKEIMTKIVCEENVVTGSVRLKDYNYIYPERQLMAENSSGAELPGEFYDFGDNFKENDEADQLAKIRTEEILSKNKIFKGTSDSRLLRAGYKFKLEKHYRDDWNCELIVTKLKLQGNQRMLFGLLPDSENLLPTFENHFESIPIDIKFRPERKTPIPKITGLMSAKLESSAGDEYAFIDDHGRYKAKMFFDLLDSGPAQGTLPIRLSQPYTGSGYGIHFPNHEGTELIWGCVDGNVDRPIGIGTIPNPSQASPVIVNNKSQNVIRTAAGNEIILDDKTDETKIDITTTDANKITLDDKDDKIELLSRDKYRYTLDDKNENITVQSKNGHILILDDKNEKICIQSKNGHMISINDGSGGENITVVDSGGGNKIVMDISNNKIVINTDDGDIDMHAENGKIDIKATELNIETSGETKIKAANIESKADGDYNVSASNITEQASGDVKTKGMNVETKGDMNAKIEAGMNLELKGSMAAKVEGGMTADLKGGAKTAITGGVVMIN